MKKTAQVKKVERADLTFETLVGSIRSVHHELAAPGWPGRQCMHHRTDWLIGCYIVEYELRGLDRAHYGQRLLARLSSRLQKSGVTRTEERELRRYRRFYLVYPQIRESLTPELL